MLLSSRLWDGRKHHLDKMSLPDLVRAYFAYPAIQVYLILGVVLAAVAAAYSNSTAAWQIPVAVLATIVVYPLVWYLLHRFVLHGEYLYKNSVTAPVWKRIHFDHHQDPNDLGVLFGALYTTLPTILVVTLPLGWLIGGLSGAAAAAATGMFVTCVYEFCHCIQHLRYAPEWRWLARIKQLHMAHHFHNEQGNYGITNFSWDRLFGTFYASSRDVPRSATVRNLGYTPHQYERYPWVAAQSNLSIEASDDVDGAGLEAKGGSAAS